MSRVSEYSFEIVGRDSGGARHHRGGHHHAHAGAALPDATVFCSEPRE